jgi:hypothetical protein
MSNFVWSKTSNPLKTFSNFLQYILGNWASISCDSTGTTVAVVNTYLPVNQIFISKNSGSSWTNLTTPIGNVNLSQVIITPNGTNLCLTAFNHALYVSNNSGSKWDEYLTDSSVYNCSAYSSNGEIILVNCSSGKNLQLSINSGINFNIISSIPSDSWNSLTMNSSGTIMAACSRDGYCYISNNTGNTWFNSSLPSNQWNSISMDSTGNNIVICSLNGYIYFSNNAGIDWASCSASNLVWNNIYISLNANIIFATATNSNNIYYSTNYGSNWATTSPTNYSTNWGGICCNNDGSIVYTCINGGYIYIGTMN